VGADWEQDSDLFLVGEVFSALGGPPTRGVVVQNGVGSRRSALLPAGSRRCGKTLVVVVKLAVARSDVIVRTRRVREIGPGGVGGGSFLGSIRVRPRLP
jgi:hypothetical protein